MASNPIDRLDQIVLEPLFQYLARRPREQLEQAALLLQRQPAQHVGGRERVESLADRADADTLDDIRRRPQHQLPQHVRDRLELTRKRIEAAGVALAQLCHRLESAAFAGQQILAVRGGQEVLRAAFDDAQAMIAQFQIGYDPRIQQTDGVGRDRVAKAGMKLRRDRGTAHHLAALDHLHAQSGHRQIGRAGEAVMPRTDDDGVGLCHVRFTLSFRDGPKDQARNLEIPGSALRAAPE